MRNLLIAAAVLLPLTATSAAVADDGANRLNVPRGEWLAPDQIIAKLSEQGYKVTEIEADDGAYEVEMTKDGIRRDAHVHPATGEVLVGYDD